MLKTVVNKKQSVDVQPEDMVIFRSRGWIFEMKPPSYYSLEGGKYVLKGMDETICYGMCAR